MSSAKEDHLVTRIYCYFFFLARVRADFRPRREKYAFRAYSALRWRSTSVKTCSGSTSTSNRFSNFALAARVFVFPWACNEKAPTRARNVRSVGVIWRSPRQYLVQRKSACGLQDRSAGRFRDLKFRAVLPERRKPGQPVSSPVRSERAAPLDLDRHQLQQKCQELLASPDIINPRSVPNTDTFTRTLETHGFRLIAHMFLALPRLIHAVTCSLIPLINFRVKISFMNSL